MRLPEPCAPCASTLPGTAHNCDEISGTRHRCICQCAPDLKRILRKSGHTTEPCTRLPAVDHDHDMIICTRCQVKAAAHPTATTAILHRHCPLIDPHPIETEMERVASIRAGTYQHTH